MSSKDIFQLGHVRIFLRFELRLCGSGVCVHMRRRSTFRNGLYWEISVRTIKIKQWKVRRGQYWNGKHSYTDNDDDNDNDDEQWGTATDRKKEQFIAACGRLARWNNIEFTQSWRFLPHKFDDLQNFGCRKIASVSNFNTVIFQICSLIFREFPAEAILYKIPLPLQCNVSGTNISRKKTIGRNLNPSRMKFAGKSVLCRFQHILLHYWLSIRPSQLKYMHVLCT